MGKAEFVNEDINLLIISHLTGSISEGDLVLLNNWINENIENRSYFNKLKDSWVLSGRNNRDTITQNEENWNTFKDKLNQNRFRLGLGNDLRSRRKASITKYVKLAASWLLIFGLGSACAWCLTNKPKDIPVIATGTANGIIEISTPLGSRSIIRMPDSSQIWLNAGTTISYDQNYGLNSRTLILCGEAFFKVAKDTLHPFIVNTQSISIRALGTSFNVKAYPDEKTISATLEEGEIDVRILSLTGKDESILLKPNDKLIYHKELGKMKKYIESSEDQFKPKKIPSVKSKDLRILSNVRTELYTSWKDPRWIIDRVPLNTLAPMLERRFNLKIIFDDQQLKKYKFTGIIENETVDQILNALRLTAPINYEIRKDTIKLTMDRSSKEEYIRIMKKNN
jgi:ferric-dicitrate binding protein FerR (iron transport regulator)